MLAIRSDQMGEDFPTPLPAFSKEKGRTRRSWEVGSDRGGKGVKDRYDGKMIFVFNYWGKGLVKLQRVDVDGMRDCVHVTHTQIDVVNVF